MISGAMPELDRGPAPREPDQPRPLVLYVHDDLSALVAERHGTGSPAARLVERLFGVLRRAGRVELLALEPQVEALVAAGPARPYAEAVAIGPAGARVAARLHARAGWFPAVRTVDLTREEDGDGGYAVVHRGAGPLAERLVDLAGAASLAIVDDTVFSGVTVRAVLDAMPAAARARAHVVCLRGVAETLAALARERPVLAGFAAPGRLLEEVSLINATGLVLRGSIRRRGQPPLAFFERPQWMRAWFGDAAEEVIAHCQALRAHLPGDAL
jgi:hypothetical protein